ncbi:MAG: FAD:protein FMN transferase [Acidobacteriota bacterium]
MLLALEAMATRFELVLEGDDPVRLQAAGEEALAEIERLDARLSRFRPTSVTSALNNRAARRPVTVDGEVLSLLRACAEVTAESGGAFDVSVGALVTLWRAAAAAGRRPDPAAIEAARAASGLHLIAIDEALGTVRFLREDLSIDFGAAGKGYAIDRAIECLRAAGVRHALLHGGTSSVHAVGPQAEGDPWPVHWVPNPSRSERSESLSLVDQALSVSATHGRTFTVDGRTYGHVIDPRTGEPVPGPRAVLVRGPQSLMCDVLSTAVLVGGGFAGLKTRPAYDVWMHGPADGVKAYEATSCGFTSAGSSSIVTRAN